MLKQCVPSEMNPPLNTTLIVDAAGLELVTNFLLRTPEFGFDIETNVTRTFTDRRVRTIQLGTRTEQYVIDMLAFAGSTDDLVGGMGSYSPAPWAKPVIDCLRPFLESADYTKVGHNLSFEYETLKWNLGLRIFGLWDTLLVEKIIYAGAVGFFQNNFWGLEDLTGRYCGLAISKDEQKSFDLESHLTQKQVEYGALDTRFPLAIKSVQVLALGKAGMGRVADIENGALPAFSDMHLNGLKIDVDAWMSELDKVKAKHQTNLDALDVLFVPLCGTSEVPYTQEHLDILEGLWRDSPKGPDRADRRRDYQIAHSTVTSWKKKSDKFEGKAGVQYGSPSQILAVLKKAGYKITSTNDNVLNLLAGDPVIDALRNYRETEKILSSYDKENYLDKHINPITGRIHPSFSQLGAATGRASCSKPNVQNISRDSAWRSCFVARPGYSIITLDYSGCELRILAEASGEQSWIDAFNKGWDVHSVGAEIVLAEAWVAVTCKGGEVVIKKGKEVKLPPCAYFFGDHQKCECPGHKLLRDQIKAINFGIAYGMEAKKLANNLGITVAAAKVLLAAWRKAFKAVVAYLERSGDSARMSLQSKTLAGRIRYYEKPSWAKAEEYARARCIEDNKPFTQDAVSRSYAGMYGSIEREGKNSPIQGTNADLIKIAMGSSVGYIWQSLEPVFGAYLVNMVHDELVVEAPTERAEECKKFVGDCMIKAGTELFKLVVAEYEGNIGPCWSK